MRQSTSLWWLQSSLLVQLLTPASSLVGRLNVPDLTALDSDEDVDGLCDVRAVYAARLRLAEEDWDALKVNPCFGEELYQEISSGKRDTVDNVEFLGRNLPRDYLLHAGSPRSKTKLPKILFLGLAHSGSTSLADEMNLHPELSYGLMKEHNQLYNMRTSNRHAFKKAYQSTFVYEEDSVKYTFDASPATLFIADEGDQDMLKHYSIGKQIGTGNAAVKAVKSLLGDLKLIIMLRDPLDWQISMTPDTYRTIEGFLDGENQVLGKRACYANSIEIWMDVFGRDSFLFLESGDYFKHPQKTLDRVFEFLEVSPKKYVQEELEAQGRRRAARKATAQERHIFWKDERMQECKQRLEALTGLTFNWKKR